MKNNARKHRRVKNTIDGLKHRLNQILPVYLSAKLKSLSKIYGLPARKHYGQYLEAKKKYAMIAQLIHLLETSATPHMELINIPVM